MKLKRSIAIALSLTGATLAALASAQASQALNHEQLISCAPTESSGSTSSQEPPTTNPSS